MATQFEYSSKVVNEGIRHKEMLTQNTGITLHLLFIEDCLIMSQPKVVKKTNYLRLYRIMNK